jgi:undecaprenyl-diphosphatase
MMHVLIEKVTTWDVLFFTSIFSKRELPALTRFMRIVSASGNGYLYPLAPAVLFLLVPDKAITFLITALIAFALELPIYYIVKQKVRRDRPFKALNGIQNKVIPSDQFSFPSGHTAAACIMATVLTSFFPAAAVPIYLWAACVGLSRVYLGVHYPTDILAGAAMGLACAMAGLHIIS